MQCLIGLVSPTFFGIGLPSGQSAVAPRSSRSGLHAYACLLNSAIFSGVGMSMTESVPRNRPAMYSRTVGFGGNSGSGPCGLANGVVPLPLVTYNFLSAAL